jgi:hypothetical protein
MTFVEWAKYGRTRGWISEIVCATHEGLPSTPEEIREWEDGADPCEHAVRVWPRQMTGCDVCGVGPDDECNDDCTVERS